MIDIKITKDIDGIESVTNAGWRDITIGSLLILLAVAFVPMALVYYGVVLIVGATILNDASVGGAMTGPLAVIFILFTCSAVVRFSDWLSVRIGRLILTAINFEPKLK